MIKISPEKNYYDSFKYLHKGDYKTGFSLFENRWHPEAMASFPKPFEKLTNQPVWRGQLLRGKSIVVQMEMGYGDCIQFVRFIPFLKLLGAKVVILQTRSLHNLFSQIPGIDHISNNNTVGPAVEADYWFGSMSLPYAILQFSQNFNYLFPITKDYVVGRDGYLTANPKPLDGKIKIGVNWSANKEGHLFKIKSLSAEDMLVLKKEFPDVTFYSLNPEDNSEFNPLPSSEWKKDWLETASYMKSMDYVITVDTGTAHLAGALGVPCLVLLPPDEHVCWRWKGEGWYSSIKKFSYPGMEGVIKYLKERLS